MSVLSKVAKPKKKTTYRKGFLNKGKIYPDGLYGLELEVEGRGLPHVNLPWTAHADGSLRGENAEYVFLTPLDFEPSKKALRELFKLFKDQGTILNESNRTSFHVHVNMKNFSIVRVANLITLYGIFEDLLLHWCGEYRVGNLFAQRMRDSSWIGCAARDALQENSFAGMGNDWRYAAMNLASINKFGSIEFRGMRGITTVEDGIHWLTMLNKLVEASENYRTPPAIVADFSGREVEMVTQVFGNELGNMLLASTREGGDDPQALLWKGVRIVQDVAFALDWEKVLDELEQPYIPDPFEGSQKKGKKNNEFFEEAVLAAERAERGGRMRNPARVFGNLANPPLRAR